MTRPGGFMALLDLSREKEQRQGFGLRNGKMDLPLAENEKENWAGRVVLERTIENAVLCLRNLECLSDNEDVGQTTDRT